MYPIYLLVVVLAHSRAASLFSNRPIRDDYAENYISPVGGTHRAKAQDWMEVSQTSGRVVRVTAGQKVELECEVIGKPPPTAVQWYKGNVPITPGRLESNLISGLGLGKLISRFVIDCVQPSHQGLYTCRAVAGGQTRVSTPSLLVVEGMGECTAEVSTEKPPKILTWSPLVLENMNNDVILPCSVQGNPKPKIYWLDENKKVVGNSLSSRVKMNEDGDLVINRLRWEDMGGYTCIAQNEYGTDSRLTFLYPMMNED